MKMEEEIQSLQAIYDDCLFDLQVYRTPNYCCCFTIRIASHDRDPSSTMLSLRITLSKYYPSSAKPSFEIVEGVNSVDNINRISKHLDNAFSRSNGHVFLFEWIESVREDASITTNFIEPLKIDESDFKAESNVEKVVFNAQCHESTVLYQRIVHGEPITDRKSTFQAHLAPVFNVKEVQLIRNFLIQDRKISRATHNIMAYRIKGDYLLKDNDDDGESGAGRNLSMLLEITSAMNVVVIVTRWHGGIQLGPDRFKHINNCARNLLQQHGYISREKAKNQIK